MGYWLLAIGGEPTGFSAPHFSLFLFTCKKKKEKGVANESGGGLLFIKK